MVIAVSERSSPAIFLAFANDEDAHLPLLKRERASISGLLQKLENRGAIQLAEDPAASIGNLFDQLTEFGRRLAIFHYAGHANGGGLLLESLPQAGRSESQFAHGEGLAGLLGRLGGLKLVILNGCATRGQVEGLLAAGVPAVIATAVPVQDEAATAFAEQFWLQLARGEPIRSAFAVASEFLVTTYGAGKRIGIVRGVGWAGKQEAAPEQLWGLYLGEGGEEALEYQLPAAVAAPATLVEIRGSLNTRLKAQLKEALIAVGGSVAASITLAEERDDDSGRETAFAIINAFPLPVGEQLRALFAKDKADRERLDQIVRTYTTTMQLFSYAALVQLWDERVRHPEVTIAPERRAMLNSFLALNENAVPTFDYYSLLVATLAILHDNGIEPFLRQSARILTDLTDERSAGAHAALESLRRALRDDLVAEADMAALEHTACDHLAELIGDLAFLTQYKSTTIRAISIENGARGGEARFIHTAIDLDGAAATPKVRQYQNWTDPRAVILQLDRRKGEPNLNLSPLVFDENAFLGWPPPKLYFFSHHVGEDHWAFRLIGRPENLVVLPDEKRPELNVIAETFRAFKTATFAP